MNRKYHEKKPNKQDFQTIRERMRKNSSILRKEKRLLYNEEDRKLENLSSKQLEDILCKIHSHLLDNDVSNAVLLMKCVSKSAENGIDILYSKNFFHPVFMYLNSDKPLSDILICFNNLSELIDESLCSISSILNNDFLNILYKFISNDSIRTAIMILLTNISNHGKDACDFLLRCDIINFYTNIPEISMDSYKEYICKTIRNIINFKVQRNDNITKDLLNVSKKFLFNSKPECKLDIVWSILYVLEESSISIDEILDKPIIEYLIELLWNKYENINLPIFQIINLAYADSSTVKKIVLDSSLFSCIPTLFPFLNNDCWKECIFFLTNVASGNSNEIEVLKSYNILPFIIYSIVNGTYRIQDETIYFFRNIMKEESAEQILFWFTKNVVFLFCELLKPGNIDRNCIILDTLICALLYSNSAEELCNLFHECNVVNAIEESKFHMTDCGYKLYKDFISILSGEDMPEIDNNDIIYNF